MAKLIDKMMNFVGWEEEEEEYIETEEAEDAYEEEQASYVKQNSSRKKKPNRVVNIHSTSQYKLFLMQPKNFDDAKKICENMKNKKPVIVNLENLEQDLAQRIVDFLSGAVYALNGNIQKVSNGIFVIAPENIDLQGSISEDVSEGIEDASLPWLK